MVKVKVISRDPKDYARDQQGGVKTQFNLNPTIHPFQVEREYIRALNSVKKDRIFAKPFVNALSGHTEGVCALARHPSSLNCLFSGDYSGEIRVWNIAECKTTWTTKAFNYAVGGIVLDSSGKILLSCGENLIKMWFFNPDDQQVTDDEPNTVLRGEHNFSTIDHKKQRPVFATGCAEVVQLWDHNRSKPISQFSWGSDSVMKVKCNPVEENIIVASMEDRGVYLIDTRQNTPLRKVFLRMKTNSMSWNPREPFMFSIANEDSNCYTYDMRNMRFPLLRHADHTNAVTGILYGRGAKRKEFVTSSYDRHVRIFPIDYVEGGKSREDYSALRMNRVFSALYSLDSQFVFCGSDDTNVRMWKSNASLPLRPLYTAEKFKINYETKLKEKFAAMPTIKSIATHRHLDEESFREKKRKHAAFLSEKRKLEAVESKLPSNPSKRKKVLASIAAPQTTVRLDE